MKKLIALCAVLTACASETEVRNPASIAGQRPVTVRCGRGGQPTSGSLYLPELKDCAITGRSRKNVNYYRVDCSDHPITYTSEGRTYVSATPRKDLIFFGVCQGAAADCGDLRGQNIAALDRAESVKKVKVGSVTELHTLKSPDGMKVKLIVGASADGKSLVAKGFFRGCTISGQ